MDINSFIYKLKQLPKHGGTGTGGGENITVTTQGFTSGDNNNVTLNGNITANSGFSGTLQDKGFKFGTSATMDDNPYTASSGTSFGTYNKSVTNLTPGVKYYYAAQARENSEDGRASYTTGGSVTYNNRPTFNYQPDRGTDLKMSALKEVYDSLQTNDNISVLTLSRLAGLQQSADIELEDFDGQQMTAYGPFNHSATCGGTQNLTHYRSKNIGGTPSGFYYSSPNNGRANFLPNGTIFQGIAQITIQNGLASNVQVCNNDDGE